MLSSGDCFILLFTLSAGINCILNFLSTVNVTLIKLLKNKSIYFSVGNARNCGKVNWRLILTEVKYLLVCKYFTGVERFSAKFIK